MIRTTKCPKGGTVTVSRTIGFFVLYLLLKGKSPRPPTNTTAKECPCMWNGCAEVLLFHKANSTTPFSLSKIKEFCSFGKSCGGNCFVILLSVGSFTCGTNEL